MVQIQLTLNTLMFAYHPDTDILTIFSMALIYGEFVWQSQACACTIGNHFLYSHVIYMIL